MSGAPRFPGRQQYARKPFIDLFDKARSRGMRLGVLFTGTRVTGLSLSGSPGRLVARFRGGRAMDAEMFDPVAELADTLSSALP